MQEVAKLLYSSVMSYMDKHWLNIRNHDRYCTLYCVQYHIQDCTEHIPDVAYYSTHTVVSKIEDISANNHRVNEANINGSWEEQHTIRQKPQLVTSSYTHINSQL